MNEGLKAAMKLGLTGHEVTKQDEFPASQRHTKEKKNLRERGKRKKEGAIN